MVFRSKKTREPGPRAQSEAATVKQGSVNGVAAPTPEASPSAPQPGEPIALSPEQLQQRAGAAKLAAAAFGEVVSVLMRSAQYKHFALTDLEWLVVPAVMTGQFSLAEAQSKTSGFTAPVGLVLWASVSAETDQRLAAEPGRQIRLRPDEWRSGDILWVVDAIGERRVVGAMLKRLRERQWQGRAVKIRTRGPDGKPEVKVLEAASGAA